MPTTDLRRPILLAVLCALGQFLLTIAILKAGFALAAPPSYGKVKLVAFASTILYPLALAHLLGMWPRLGMEWSTVRLQPVFVASLATVALFLAFGLRQAPGPGLGADLTIQLFNAFGEELLFRGVIFALLASLAPWRAIALNGLLFGSMHLIHGVMDGNWQAAAWQACVTAVCGTMFTAVRMRTGSLWLVVILHMGLNLAMMYSRVQVTMPESTVFLVERAANVFELALALYVAWQASRARSLA
ncbi:MAG: CPBP family intramembrane glutamic endopeptidase [Telluria sp.]